MKTSRDNKILEMYYECALKEVADQKEEIEYLKNKLVEASRRIQELEGENLIWTQRCSRAEGKLNRAKNIIACINSSSPNGTPWICDLSVVNISNNKVTATVAE